MRTLLLLTLTILVGCTESVAEMEAKMRTLIAGKTHLQDVVRTSEVMADVYERKGEVQKAKETRELYESSSRKLAQVEQDIRELSARMAKAASR